MTEGMAAGYDRLAELLARWGLMGWRRERGVMNETYRPRRIGRSIGALLAGFLTVLILSLGTDFVLHAVGVFPRLGQPMADALLLLATVYRTVYGVAGSYITARLAPDRPMQHALAGGVVGLILSTVGAVVTWNRGTPSGPTGIPSPSSQPRCPAPGRVADSASCSCAHGSRYKECLPLKIECFQKERLFRVLTKEEVIATLQHRVGVSLPETAQHAGSAAVPDDHGSDPSPHHQGGFVRLDGWQNTWRRDEAAAKARNLEQVRTRSSSNLHYSRIC